MDKERSGPSAWTIAAGVFLGLTMLKACSVLTEAAVQKAAFDQYNTQISEIRQEQRTVQLNRERLRQLDEIRAQRAAEIRALGPGERCIEHRRFRRIQNGWEQAGSC